MAQSNICLDVQKQKENPAKGRVSRLLVGRVSLFPLREEALLTNNYASEIRLSKSLGISWLTDLRNLLRMGSANSSQGLAPHTPQRRLSRLLFLCLLTLQKQAATH